MPEQERNYEVFLPDEEDGLIFVIKHRDSKPEDPWLLYDGGKHALFHRDPEHSITLDFLHFEVQKELKEAVKVSIIEQEDDEALRQYDVPVRAVKKLPLSKKSQPKPELF